ncbi:hypothetical protein BDFB_001941 [Asbolus verrucosus]|uniref:Uncharacterized protein n=1 Tax=Asbolus verrucosus TaxID=1661398 RepID=A0A482VA88_ASBVE|nr:hypothetical protein BDFB_001941 [Asbolus verrucosus]
MRALYMGSLNFLTEMASFGHEWRWECTRVARGCIREHAEAGWRRSQPGCAAAAAWGRRRRCPGVLGQSARSEEEIDIGAIGPGQAGCECRLAEHRGWAVAIDTGGPRPRPAAPRTCSLRWRAVAVGDRLGSRGRWGLAVIFASGSGHGGWPAFTECAERGPTPARCATPTAAAAAELLKLSPAQHPCRRRQPGSDPPAPDPGPGSGANRAAPVPQLPYSRAPELRVPVLHFHSDTCRRRHRDGFSPANRTHLPTSPTGRTASSCHPSIAKRPLNINPSSASSTIIARSGAKTPRRRPPAYLADPPRVLVF